MRRPHEKDELMIAQGTGIPEREDGAKQPMCVSVVDEFHASKDGGDCLSVSSFSVACWKATCPLSDPSLSRSAINLARI